LQLKDAVATEAGQDFQERYVDADGFRIRYLEAGYGDALVCIHGAGGLRLSRAHDLLSNEFRVIVFEVPGFGESPVPRRRRSGKRCWALNLCGGFSQLLKESRALVPRIPTMALNTLACS